MGLTEPSRLPSLYHDPGGDEIRIRIVMGPVEIDEIDSYLSPAPARRPSTRISNSTRDR